MPTAHARAVKSIEKLLRPSALRFVRFTHTESERQKRRVRVLMSCSGAARGEGGKVTSNGWTSKNYVICVCSFHCHGTSSYHTTNTLQGRREQRATLIHRQYNRDWGTSYSRPPIDPYLTSGPCYRILAAPLRSCMHSQRSCSNQSRPHV